MGLVAHAGPSAPLLGLELVVPLVLLGLAGTSDRRRDALLLAVAAGAVAVVILPPVQPVTERSVTGHMVQHLVLIVVAAPCVGAALERTPPLLRRRSIGRVLSRSIASPATPVVAGALHAVTIVLWHLPGPYEAAVQVWPLHGLEHLTMLGSGVWWWASVAHHARRRGVGAAIGSVFVVATSGAAMGVFMMFAPVALYDQGGVTDQQIAGALMAGGPGAVFGATALALTARAIERTARPRPLRVPVPRGPLVIVVALVGLSGVVAAADVGVVAAADVATGDDAAASSPVAVQDAEDSAAIGETLYRRDCASCHGDDGAGSWRGVPLTDAGSADLIYMLGTGRMPIASPDDRVRRSDPRYSPDEIDAIVEHVVDLVGDPAPLPAFARATGAGGRGDVADGGEHYRTNCSGCHGGTGRGGALALEGFAPPLMDSGAQTVVAAMVAGPGAMPTFDSTLSDAEMADVVAYVGVLQDPTSTGLRTPAGRVGEGLVAGIVGLGALMLLARAFGSDG